jgi:hypothetical protein
MLVWVHHLEIGSIYSELLTAQFFSVVGIYAGVAASLAERKKGGQLTEFLKNIRGTIEDDEWDQVMCTCFFAAFGFESQKQKYVFAVDNILMQGYFGSSSSPCYYLIRCSASI